MQGWTQPESQEEAAGNSKCVTGVWDYRIPFQIPEAKPWDKAGNMCFEAPPLGRGLKALQINLTPALHVYLHTWLHVMSLY